MLLCLSWLSRQPRREEFGFWLIWVVVRSSLSLPCISALFLLSLFSDWGSWWEVVGVV